MILHYLDGEVTLHLILTTGAAIYQHMGSNLPPDLKKATATLSSLSEHTNTKSPYTFLEHLEIEDTLITIMEKLQK